MAAALDELQRRQGVRPAWLLEIDGIPQRFYSGDPPASTAIPAGYSAVFANIDVSVGESKIDQRKAIVEDGAASVTLTVTRGSGIDELLLRLRADREVSLASTVIASTGATTVTVNEDISGWPATGVIWVGQEAMAYSARTLVSPFQFTINAGDRGYYGSQVQEHTVDANQNWFPKVSDACIAWRGRRARLKVAAGRRMGQTPTADYLTEVSGFIDRTPTKSGQQEIQLTIVPDTARLERKIGGDAAVTRLQQGWHAFDPQNATAEFRGPRVSWVHGQLYRARLTANANAGVTVNLAVDNVEQLLAIHNFANPIVLDFGAAASRVTAIAAAVGGAPPAGTITLSAAIPFFRGTGALIYNSPFPEFDDIDLAPGAVIGPYLAQWPQPSLDLIHATLAPGWTGAAGDRRVDFRITEDVNESPVLAARMNITATNGDPAITVEWPQRRLWYGISLADPESAVPNNQQLIRGQNRVRLGAWPERRLELDFNDQSDQQEGYIPIRGVARAYYQNDERYIWVEDDVFRMPSAASPIYIRAKFEELGFEHQTVHRVVDKFAAATITPGAPGYILTVAERSLTAGLSFGDWPDGPRVEIREHAGWTAATPNQIILELLLSGSGNGVNHPTYDALPFGCNIDQSQVDVDGIEAFASPAIANNQTLHIEDEVEVGEVIAPLLRLMGAMLSPRINRATGARELTLIPVGAPTPLDSVHAVLDGDWAVDDRPRTETDDGIINVIHYALNWVEGESTLSVRVVQQDSVTRYEEAQEQEENLHGVTIDSDDPIAHRDAMLGPALNQFSELADPRRVLRGSIALADAVTLDVGAVVNVTALDAQAYDGTLGVSGVSGRIMSIRRQWGDGTAELSIRIYDALATGWAPSLEVAAIIDPTTLQVTPNAYTRTVHPITGEAQEDLDYWNPGDGAAVMTTGDYATFAGGLVVLTVDTTLNRIQFTAPHGLGGLPATVRPDDYNAASTYHRQFAYLADDANTLGAAGDEAKDYS